MFVKVVFAGITSNVNYYYKSEEKLKNLKTINCSSLDRDLLNYAKKCKKLTSFVFFFFKQ